MRLPLVEGSKTIDQEAVQTMTDLAMAAGVNYYDTAWPYHDGNSETSIAKALAKYPRVFCLFHESREGVWCSLDVEILLAELDVEA